MESPSKRLRQSPPSGFEGDADFVPLGGNEEEENANQFGYGTTNGSEEVDISSAPRGPRAMYHQPNQQPHYNSQPRNARNDPRNAKDRPKSKHALPGHEPWILVKTKFGRRFVHNTDTRESLWRIPQDIMPAVKELEHREREQREKQANATWAEDQLKEMRDKDSEKNVAEKELGDNRPRRRSESLQREDEEAMMAELAAEAERKEEEDAKQAVENVESLKPVVQRVVEEGSYGSDSSYEEVEVTDSEFEDGEEREQGQKHSGTNGVPLQEQQQQQEPGPVEFGEDDIAYQLAAMGEDYNDNSYESNEEEWDGEESPENQTIDSLEATNIFRSMLDDHNISPFTPWDTLIADESPSSILMDDRYTILPNMRTRKAVWESWVKDTAARLKAERENAKKIDPKIPFLAFLQEKASPKLYWPEFKRKFKKEKVMNERAGGLSDKEREKLYREYVGRLKLPESTRKGDLMSLLGSFPLAQLNKSTSLEALPQELLAHVHYICLPAKVRDEIIVKHVAGLPSAPEASKDQGTGNDGGKREERRRQEKALAERERKVEEERRKAEKEERWAKRELRKEEDELRRAMDVDGRGLKDLLREDGDGKA